MPKPLIVTISHSLGREQARARLQERIGVAKQMLATYRVAMVADQWEGDRLTLGLSALGQNIRGTVDVLDDMIRVEVQLPWLLASFAERIKAMVQQKAPALLGPPARNE